MHPVLPDAGSSAAEHHRMSESWASWCGFTTMPGRYDKTHLFVSSFVHATSQCPGTALARLLSVFTMLAVNSNQATSTHTNGLSIK